MASSTAAGTKRGISATNINDDKGNEDQTTFKSSPITDRASTFIAHFHPWEANQGPNNTRSGKATSLTQTIKAYQSHPAFANADHRIAAWRRASTQRTLTPTLTAANSTNVNANVNVTYTTHSDDDGEKYAGKRLERVLAEMEVQGCVVVARWYGGVLLGPVRFAHIEGVAREAVAKWRSWTRGKGADDGGWPKRMKLGGGGGGGGGEGRGVAGAMASGVQGGLTPAQEEGQRVRLVEALGNRDNSIVVLRALLAEKKLEKELREKGTAPTPAAALVSSQPPASSSPSEPAVKLISKEEEEEDSAGGPESSQTSQGQSSSSAGGNDDVVAKSALVTTTKPQAMDYGQMPMSKLRQFEKARDATIAFILKQIDKAEAEEKEVEKKKGKERAT